MTITITLTNEQVAMMKEGVHYLYDVYGVKQADPSTQYDIHARNAQTAITDVVVGTA